MTKLCPRGKAAAKRKFKVYPSAYANAYASKICAGKAKDPSGVKRKDWGPKKMNEGKEVKVKKKIPQSRILTNKKKKDKIIPYATFNKRQSVLKNDNNKTVEKGKSISVGASKGKFDVNLNLDQSKQKSKYFKEKNIKRGITGSYRGNKGNVSINVSKDKRSNPYSGSLSGTSVNISGKIRLDKIFNKNKGGEMKIKKANMGAAMMFKDDIRGKGALLPMFGLAGMAKYQSMNKKKNNMPEDKKASGITKKETEGLAGGGMPEPTGSGSYIKQDIDGDESFTNASAQAYYKDLLD